MFLKINPVRKLNNGENIPYDLLLLADGPIEAINRYINNSEIYVLRNSGFIKIGKALT